MSEYAERDLSELDDYYYRHVNAMTGEKLHSKSAIAAELAWRDKRIAELAAENAELRDQQEELLAELAGLIALIDYESLTLPARELMAKCMRQRAEVKKGCGKPLAPNQWWKFCGETDMGQSLPALCTECGGELKLAD